MSISSPTSIAMPSVRSTMNQAVVSIPKVWRMLTAMQQGPVAWGLHAVSVFRSQTENKSASVAEAIRTHRTRYVGLEIPGFSAVRRVARD